MHDEPGRDGRLDAAQLFKHAFAFRAAVHERSEYRTLAPVLFYVYAEPHYWPNSGAPADEGAKARHRAEIDRFAAAVADDEVTFVSCSRRKLLEIWRAMRTAALAPVQDLIAAVASEETPVAQQILGRFVRRYRS